MGRVRKGHNTFFKVMFENYTDRLRIPPAFVKNFKGKSCKRFILKTDHTKRVWILEMEQIDKDYFFENGWRKFVEDCQIELGDFLVFWLVSDSMFDVLIYGRSGCPKKVNSALKRHGDLSRQNRGNPCEDEHTTTVQYKKPFVSGTNVQPASSFPLKMEAGSEGVMKAAGFAKPRHPYFAMILKKHNRYMIVVPIGFAVGTEMKQKRKTVLRDDKGRAWQVKIRVRKAASQKKNAALRIELGNGWSEFRKANNLAEGDACLFEYIPDKDFVIHVHIRRNGGSTGDVVILD